MLVEKNLKEALEYYIKGKSVTALWMGEDGSMNAMPLSDILDQPEKRMEEETIDLPANNIDEKKEKIRKLVEEGYTNREIADQTGIPFGTVGYHAARFRKKEKDPAVDNSDRHLCKTCKFRSNRPTVNSCDYAGLMKHSRGCKVEECTKYEKGVRMRVKDVEE